MLPPPPPASLPEISACALNLRARASLAVTDPNSHLPACDCEHPDIIDHNGANPCSPYCRKCGGNAPTDWRGVPEAATVQPTIDTTLSPALFATAQRLERMTAAADKALEVIPQLDLTLRYTAGVRGLFMPDPTTLDRLVELELVQEDEE